MIDHFRIGQYICRYIGRYIYRSCYSGEKVFGDYSDVKEIEVK